MIKRTLLILAAIASLSGCDQLGQKLGLEDQAKKEAAQQAEAKAVGSACRQSGRAIEDCYSIYNWLPKAGIYDGWKDMDAYMRENQLETVTPQLPPPESPGAAKKRKKAEAAEQSGDKPAKAAAKEEKSTDKAEEAPAKNEEKGGKH